MKVRTQALLAVLALGAAACGSDEPAPGGNAAEGAPSEAETAAEESHGGAADDEIDAQRAALAEAYAVEAFGPQAPRDIQFTAGANPVSFAEAPSYTEMNLCNIHFHEGAEHKGGEYTTYAGNGDGEGYGTGYLYDGELTEAELAPFDSKVGGGEHGDLVPGDTIEIHYVHTTDEIVPGPTLGSCLAAEDSTPQLRVEAQVYVLVNDESAGDLADFASVDQVDGGRYQAVNLPDNLGTPVQYAGSTTGPSYNQKGSPFQVSWSVHPEVAKVSIASVAAWLADNPFDEDHAHGVRNLVTNPELISPIE